MGKGAAPWKNVVVKYCPRCRLVSAPQATRCERCGGDLVDQVRREKLEER